MKQRTKYEILLLASNFITSIGVVFFLIRANYRIDILWSLPLVTLNTSLVGILLIRLGRL